METKWNCPHCGFENTDNQDETILPLCGGCYEQVFWREIEAVQQGAQATLLEPPHTEVASCQCGLCKGTNTTLPQSV